MFLSQVKCQVLSVLSKSSRSSTGTPGVQVPELMGRCLSRNEDQWGVCDGTALGIWKQYCLKHHLGRSENFFKTLILPLGT